MPRISRHPSAFTPVAIRRCTSPCGRPRGPSGSARRSGRTCTAPGRAAGSGRTSHQLVELTRHSADLRLDRPTTPREAASFSTRRVETPSGSWSRQPRPAPLGPPAVLQEAREVRPLAQLGDRQLDRPGPGIPLPAAVTVKEFARSGLTSPYPAFSDLDVGVHRPLGDSRMIARSTIGSPMPGSPRTARREPARCHLRPFRSPSLL